MPPLDPTCPIRDCAKNTLRLVSIHSRKMNFYFEAAKILDKLEKKQGSIKGVLSDVAEKDRKRTSALVIESLKCTFALVVS
jgi:uncharacterized lipoprotein YehR (DUF1307 family)